jgi:hypothetical protein
VSLFQSVASRRLILALSNGCWGLEMSLSVYLFSTSRSPDAASPTLTIAFPNAVDTVVRVLDTVRARL